MRHSTPIRHFIERTQMDRRKGKHACKSRNLQTEEEGNGLNIRSTWYEHDPKGYVLEKGEAGGTLLYSSPLSSYNPSYTAGRKRP